MLSWSLGGTGPLLNVGMPAYATVIIEDNDRESTLLQCCSSGISSVMLLIVAHTNFHRN